MTKPRAAAAAVPVTSGAIRRGRGGSDLLFICLGGIALIQLPGRMAPRHLQEAGQALVQLRSVDFTVLAEAPPTVAAAAMALLGPLLMRLPWQAGLALTGLAWIMLVGLALHLERAAEVAFDVLPPAIGLAGTLMLALGLQRSLQRRARPADPVGPGTTGEAPGRAPLAPRRRSASALRAVWPARQ